MTSKHKILLLGEGNFSFAASFFHKIEALKVQYDMVATSFDSREDLLMKYPSILPILNELDKSSSTQILHDIDATNISKSSLNKKVFSDIIFNFPHLGKEDCNAHSSMLAHIMNSCKPLMNGVSTLTITLAESQGNLWKIHEMATRNKLELVSELNFIASEWPGYVLMRHHVGKSFGGRVQRCIHYSFKLQQDEKTNGDHPFLLHYLYSNRIVLSNTTPQVNETSNSTAGAIEDVKNVPKDSKKKRKNMDIEVEGKYHTVTMDSEKDEAVSTNASSLNRFDVVSGIGWKCDLCGRILSTEQGVKTHVYAHIISSNQNSTTDGLSSSSNLKQDLKCPHCDKVSPNEDALTQHIRAKHGLHSDIKPDWAKGNMTKNNSQVDSHSQFECIVCGVAFDTEDSLKEHMESGFLPQSVSLSHSCSRCNKIFSDERGLKQHINFCWANDQQNIL